MEPGNILVDVEPEIEILYPTEIIHKQIDIIIGQNSRILEMNSKLLERLSAPIIKAKTK